MGVWGSLAVTTKKDVAVANDHDDHASGTRILEKVGTKCFSPLEVREGGPGR